MSREIDWATGEVLLWFDNEYYLYKWYTTTDELFTEDTLRDQLCGYSISLEAEDLADWDEVARELLARRRELEEYEAAL